MAGPTLKKTLKITGVALVILIFISVWFLRPFASHDFDITFNEEKIKAKEAFLSGAVADSAGVSKPNIIILFADDLGKTDISLYGNKIVQTKNIDSLAAEGVVFNEGYVTAPICSPSRAGLLTGRYQQRFGHEQQPAFRYPKNRLEQLLIKYYIKPEPIEFEDITKCPTKEAIDKQGLPLEEITLADLLRKNGYATGITGKWHLGFAERFIPTKRGFDEHYGFYEAYSWFADTTRKDILNLRHKGIMDEIIWKNGNSLTSVKRRNDKVIDENEYYTFALAREANRFIETNKDKPFFLYVPFNAPHTPFQALKSEVAKYQTKGVTDLNKAVYYAMISGLDSAVGLIHQKVKDLGIEKNTLIVFLSDNGAATYTEASHNEPLKGGKMSLYEGGINVPFVFKWTGKIKPGTVYNKPVTSLDIFSTAAAISGSALPKDREYDGVNLIRYLAIKDTATPHPVLYWRSGPNKAIRKGDWKLVLNLKDNITALYDLANDKNEKSNLADKEQAKVEELKKDLEVWERKLSKPLWPSTGYYKNYFDGKVDRFAL